MHLCMGRLAACWSVGWSAGQLAGWPAGQLAVRPVGRLAGRPVGQPAGLCDGAASAHSENESEANFLPVCRGDLTGNSGNGGAGAGAGAGGDDLLSLDM